MTAKAELWWAVTNEEGPVIMDMPNGVEIPAIFGTKEEAEDVRAKWSRHPSIKVEPVSVVRDGGKLAKGKG